MASSLQQFAQLHYPSTTSNKFLREVWDKMKLTPTAVFEEVVEAVAMDNNNAHLKQLLKYNTGLGAGRSITNEVKDRGYCDGAVGADWHRYTFFPVVKGFRTEFWGAFCSSKPSMFYNSVPETLKYTFDDTPQVVIDIRNVRSSKSSVASMISAVSMLRAYISATFPAGNTVYIYLSPLRTKGSVGFDSISGSSMGLAVAASIVGAFPLCYTGYVQDFKTRNAYLHDNFPPSGSYQPNESNMFLNTKPEWSWTRFTELGPKTASHELTTFAEILPDDDIHEVSSMPIKIAACAYFGIPLLIPHTSNLLKTLNSLMNSVNAAVEIRNAMDTATYKQDISGEFADPTVAANLGAMLDRVLRNKQYALVARDVDAVGQDAIARYTKLREIAYGLVSNDVTYPGFIAEIANHIMSGKFMTASQRCFAVGPDDKITAVFTVTSLAEVPLICRHIAILGGPNLEPASDALKLKMSQMLQLRSEAKNLSSAVRAVNTGMGYVDDWKTQRASDKVSRKLKDAQSKKKKEVTAKRKAERDDRTKTKKEYIIQNRESVPRVEQRDTREQQNDLKPLGGRRKVRVSDTVRHVINPSTRTINRYQDIDDAAFSAHTFGNQQPRAQSVASSAAGGAAAQSVPRQEVDDDEAIDDQRPVPQPENKRAREGELTKSRDKKTLEKNVKEALIAITSWLMQHSSSASRDELRKNYSKENWMKFMNERPALLTLFLNIVGDEPELTDKLIDALASKIPK